MQRLDLWNCEITSLEGLKGLVNLQRLDLWNCEITSLEGLKGLVNLQSFNTNSKKLTNLEGLKGLINLQSLIVNGDKLTNLEGLKGLVNLQKLDLWNYEFKNLELLKGLINLQNLSINGLKLTNLEGLKDLINLQNLSINGLKLTNLEGLKDLINLEKLDIFNYEFLNLEGLKDLINLKDLNISNNKVKNLEPLKDVINLQKLSIRRNQMTSLEELKNLTNLQTLDLSDNQIENPNVLLQLRRLRKINISSTNIKDLRPFLEYIKNDVPIRWSFGFHYSSIAEITVADNAFTYPPSDVVKLGNAAILQYFEDLEREGEAVNEYVKCIVLGNGCVGKTTLIRRLKENPSGEIETDIADRTHGIIINNWAIPDTSMVANIWDFGGQEIYHATHRLFLSGRTLYLLIWTDKHEDPTDPVYNPPEYWLDYIADLGRESRILLVQNKLDKDGRKDLPMQAALLNYYEKRFDLHFATPQAVSAKTGKKRPVLLEEIKDNLQELLETYKEVLPKNWVRVRDIIVRKIEQKEKMMEYTDYEALCEQESVAQSKEVLLGYLNNAGIVYYQKGLFDNKIILDQQWAVDAVYKVFKNEMVNRLIQVNESPFLTLEDMKMVWQEHPMEEINVFIGFMISCEIAFNAGSEEQPKYVIPQLLSEQQPRNVRWKYADADCWHYRLSYLFLHPSLIERFIIRTAKEHLEGYCMYWKNGILYEDKKTKSEALVEVISQEGERAAHKRHIRIKTNGTKAPELLANIRKTFDEIRSFTEETLEEISLDGNTWEKVSSLIKNAEQYSNRGGETSRVVGTYARFLNALDRKDKFNILAHAKEQNKTSPVRIFLSYAPEDVEHKNCLSKLLAPLRRNKTLTTWDEQEIKPGEIWAESVNHALEQAELIILLVSSDFLASDYLMEDKLPKMERRRMKGELEIIPILLKECLWKSDQVLEQLQPLPRGITSISAASDKDKTWNDIAKEIEQKVQTIKVLKKQ